MGAIQGELDLEMMGNDTLEVRLRGPWRLDTPHPDPSRITGRIENGVRRVRLDGSGITDWDTGLLTFLAQLIREAQGRDVAVDRTRLPAGVQRILDLAFAVPEKKDTGRGSPRERLVVRVGRAALAGVEEARDLTEFIGKATLSFGRLLVGRARFRRTDLMLAIQECGAEALGIVSLISFLIGLILAFMGAIQLKIFGAEIYVANLVAIGMAREMSAMMTGIVLAGRTGASYAAQLGTMTVNEEIDALRTLGISPMDFLVLPRMLALMLMMPLLALYSNLLGILGGFAVGSGLLGIAPILYLHQTIDSVSVTDFAVGLVKAAVIGVLVAVAGCMRGMQCGRSASAVGLATTSAVVTAIVMIIVSEALFAVLFETLGI